MNPLSIRERLEFQDDWYVSPSAADAALAAREGTWTLAQLELANDPANHPQLIDLPGGPQFGKRPLDAPTHRSPTAILDLHDREELEHWVGFMPELDPKTARLPSPFLTYAKTLDIPADFAGKRLYLTLDEARYDVTGHINGKLFCHYLGGLEPHRFDVTDLLTPGETALLQITVGDCGVSGNKPFDPYNYTGNRLPNCAEIRANLTHPVNYGGADRAVGRVTLEALPPVHVDWLLAQPRVLHGQLDLTIRLVNTTATDQNATLYCVADSDPSTLHDSRGHIIASQHKPLADADVLIPANSSAEFQFTIDWPDAHLWDLDSPTLYQLTTSLLIHGLPVDTHHDYFGFREFLINGHSYYLNGKKIHLTGQAGHVTRKQETWPLEQKIAFLRAWKERGNITHLRLHAKPWDRTWVLAADRVGLLITTETALWTTGFASFDWVGSEQDIYRNLLTHFLDGVVRRDRNNPSVVMWSLSNEMSPITSWDLEDPRMAAMDRIFERIIAQAREIDDSRVIQMSSAMDFLGRLSMYNLHYPKSWQAFPDYPNTAYWLDQGFLFPWYGAAKKHLPAWSWRKDKPLYFGEFGCVIGVTPDAQATMIGDIAFEQADWGSALAQKKIWLTEIPAYRRQDVSGFCAWIPMFGGDIDLTEHMNRPNVVAHTHACRPLAILSHSYHEHVFANDEITIEMSMHNDTRHHQSLSVACGAAVDGKVFWTEKKTPTTVFGPAQNRTFTTRFRAPEADSNREVTFHATLKRDGQVADEWSKIFHVWARAWGKPLPETCAFFDPDGRVRALLARRGIAGGTILRTIGADDDLSKFNVLWLSFKSAMIRRSDWRTIRAKVLAFAHAGGCVVLDQPDGIESDPPLRLKPTKGYAQPGDRFEIITSWIASPHHPIMSGLTDADFDRWGRDYYQARTSTDIPQEGRFRPLLVAGLDRHGLVSSPLSEVLHGKGSVLVSHLEIFSKLEEHPPLAKLVTNIASYRPTIQPASTGICVGPETLARLREIGLEAPNATLGAALEEKLALIDGSMLVGDWRTAVGAALAKGKTVYLHELWTGATEQLLSALRLPGRVKPGTMPKHGNDLIRHAHPLADGLTNNQLFWIFDKANTAPWTHGAHHPEPASALIDLTGASAGISLTQRGALTVYPVGPGTLIIDNLRWQLPDLDEPERARRLITILLTNAGAPLDAGAEKKGGMDYETAADRRERGMF